MLIDTHAHLYDEKYQEEKIEELVKRARGAGVQKIIVNGTNKETSLKSIALAEQFDLIYAAIGLHPSEVKDETDEELKWLESLIINNKVIAVGEIGLDYYWDTTHMEKQKKMFIKQIQIANKFNLPVIVHSRDAIQDTYDILKENRVNGVLHAYSSSLEMARKFIQLGYYIGVGGVVTFPKAKNIKEVVKEVPLEYIVSETDCPYLTPVPFRGKMNRTEYVSFVVEEIANIKNIPVSIVIEEIARNVKKIFHI